MIFLLAAIAASTETERFLYYCKGAESPVEFSLAYKRSGSHITNVRVVDRDSPRLPPDQVTQWRGKTTEQGATFSFNVTRKGLWTSGEMTLVSNSKRVGHFRLTWSSVLGAKDSHIPFGTPEQSADCVLAEQAAATD